MLKQFRVNEFQSIRDSNPVDIGEIACLVGKNEAGKTALLRALYRLNPINQHDDKFDITDDFPRAYVTDYELAIKRGEREHAIVVAATFALEPDGTVGWRIAHSDVVAEARKSRTYLSTLVHGEVKL